MPSNGHRFRVVEKQIPDVLCHDDGALGIVKVQMPEQCDDNGMFFRIRDRERERNLRIIRNTIAAFGNWAQQVNAPAIILFPELSVSAEAADELRTEMATARITPNTLIVLGMEHLRRDHFICRASDSHSRADFAGTDFGPNIDRVNTAVILAKDKAGNVSCYYQPKCSRSDYESPRQFTSNIIYKFAFGQHHFIVNICSDFFLQAGAMPLVGSVGRTTMRCISTGVSGVARHIAEMINVSRNHLNTGITAFAPGGRSGSGCGFVGGISVGSKLREPFGFMADLIVKTPLSAKR